MCVDYFRLYRGARNLRSGSRVDRFRTSFRRPPIGQCFDAWIQGILLGNPPRESKDQSKAGGGGGGGGGRGGGGKGARGRDRIRDQCDTRTNSYATFKVDVVHDRPAHGSKRTEEAE